MTLVLTMPHLVVCYEWQQSEVAGTLDGLGQLALLAFGQAGFLARFNLPVLVDVALQRLEIFVVEIGYVCSVLKNLCHTSP